MQSLSRIVNRKTIACRNYPKLFKWQQKSVGILAFGGGGGVGEMPVVLVAEGLRWCPPCLCGGCLVGKLPPPTFPSLFFL